MIFILLMFTLGSGMWAIHEYSIGGPLVGVILFALLTILLACATALAVYDAAHPDEAKEREFERRRNSEKFR